MSCNRTDYSSGIQKLLPDAEIHQLDSGDEFIVREPDGSVWFYDIVFVDYGNFRVEAKLKLFNKK